MMTWKEVVVAHPMYYHGFSWRNEQEKNIRMANSPAEIRTWQLENRKEKRYCLAEFSRFRTIFVNILSAVTVTRFEPSNSECGIKR
jgi:hypothetical protein